MLAPLAERQAALESRHPRWVPRRLDEALDDAARQWGDRPYVITDDATWTYAEVQRRSLAVAAGLARLGVEPGDHVAVVMANYPDFVPLKYGIARLGATCVPINFLNRRDELAYVLRQSDAVVLVTMDRFRQLDYLRALDELAPGWGSGGGGDAFPRLRHVVVHPGGFAQLVGGGSGEWTPVPSDPGGVADILYTSGTTGEPKGVLLTHDMLLRTAYGSAFGRGFEDGRRITFALPMYHVYGYVEGMLAALFVGGAIIPQLSFDPAATLRAIGRHRATDALFIPTMTMAVLDELDRGGYDLSSLASVISSGGISPTGLWERIEAALAGVELTTGYGMTETTASTTVTRPDDPPERRRSTNGRLRDVGVAGEAELGGRLAVYRVVDTVTGAPLPEGSVGELVVRGPGVTAGYYRKPEETAAAIDAQGWLHTGDLGLLLPDDYVVLTGRLKECYRCGGEQVMPKEVEDVLTGHPSVAQAYVVPVPDPRMGEVGVAWIVAAEGAAADPDAIVAYCAERLARFKVPRHVLAIDASAVPTTPSGRPRKFLLADLAVERLGVSS